MKKRAEKNDKFSSTEVGTLIEQLRSEFKVFGEGLKDLREKFDTLAGMVANHEEKSIWSRLEINAIKERLTKIDGKLARIEDNLKSKADQKDLQTLEKKVTSLTR